MPDLGWDPITTASVILSKGADLVFNLPATDASGNTVTWPVGSTSTITFYNKAKTAVLTKAGVVTPNRIDYIVQSEDLAPILSTASTFDLLITLPQSPTQEFMLYTGSVKRKDGAK
ncbi:LtfC-like domain-containing protein [Williamsia phyllosphaerae]|uniref:LtfC/p132/Gp6 beta-sandwich domain-containing protein n=1 Tax=Williamsia phyllosphaerae TaxID=885042 RepID=A0ABQ1V6I6_9NOCA|nr:hypothetical protein [Williamsia phyllosphaerae]GGF39244.1 hypothetical protein GCM10007298_38680 [Williamsia phyllosphaerae]